MVKRELVETDEGEKCFGGLVGLANLIGQTCMVGELD